MNRFCKYKSKVGMIYICEQDGMVTYIGMQQEKIPKDADMQESPVLNEAIKQLSEYFDGKRKEFKLPIKVCGTEFQMKVWQKLKEIPYGETWSYGQLAAAIGNPRAQRAVGMANNRNPISIVVPCHRVIGADGSLTGYGGGLDMKKMLLELEAQNT